MTCNAWHSAAYLSVHFDKASLPLAATRVIRPVPKGITEKTSGFQGVEVTIMTASVGYVLIVVLYHVHCGCSRVCQGHCQIRKHTLGRAVRHPSIEDVEHDAPKEDVANLLGSAESTALMVSVGSKRAFEAHCASSSSGCIDKSLHISRVGASEAALAGQDSQVDGIEDMSGLQPLLKMMTKQRSREKSGVEVGCSDKSRQNHGHWGHDVGRVSTSQREKKAAYNITSSSQRNASIKHLRLLPESLLTFHYTK
jgi:hypothetical protein